MACKSSNIYFWPFTDGVGVPRPRLTPAALVRGPLKDFRDDSKVVSPALGTLALAAACRHGKHETGVGGPL